MKLQSLGKGLILEDQHVYAVLDPEPGPHQWEVRYVGITRNLERRLAFMLGDARKGSNKRLHVWIRERLLPQELEPKLVVLEFIAAETATKSEVVDAEADWIFTFWERGQADLNATAMNRGMVGRRHTKEAKQSISEAMSGEKNPMCGRTVPEERRERISESLKGKLTGEDNPFYGREHSEETKEKIREGVSGENHPNSKITDVEVKRLRELYATGDHTQKALAERFGIIRKYVSSLIPGRYRRDAGGPIKGVDY